MKISSTKPGIFPVLALLVVATATATGCSRQQDAASAEAAPATAPTLPASDAPIPATSSPYDALPETERFEIDERFTGDLDDMIARRAIRVAVTFNRTHYFIDKGQERGLTAAGLETRAASRRIAPKRLSHDGVRLRRETATFHGGSRTDLTDLNTPTSDRAMPEAAAAARSSFGPYKVRRVIGSGGCGKVYLAHNTELDRPVAIEVLRPANVSRPEVDQNQHVGAAK